MNPPPMPTPDAVLAATLKVCAVDFETINDTGRHPRTTLARRLFAYSCRRWTLLSYPQIGLALGRRSHASAVEGDRRVRRELEAPPVAALLSHARAPGMGPWPVAHFVELIRRELFGKDGWA